ncbi:MAG: hypothetical protein WBW73_01625, partial [Rhodoplanes sp.]
MPRGFPLHRGNAGEPPPRGGGRDGEDRHGPDPSAAATLRPDGGRLGRRGHRLFQPVALKTPAGGSSL